MPGFSFEVHVIRWDIISALKSVKKMLGKSTITEEGRKGGRGGNGGREEAEEAFSLLPRFSLFPP
jgi:hypothetical protein